MGYDKESSAIRRGTTTILLLNLLAECQRPMHGYEIIKELEGRSNGYFALKEGLIYPRLHELERQGFLKSKWQGTEGSRRRKMYEITPDGLHRLAEEREQWRALRVTMDALLGTGGKVA